MVKLFSFASRVLQVMVLSQESAHSTFISQNLMPKGPLGTDRLLCGILYRQSEISRETQVHFEEKP